MDELLVLVIYAVGIAGSISLGYMLGRRIGR